MMRILRLTLLAAFLVTAAGTARAASDAAAFVQQLGNQAIQSLTGAGLSAAERQSRFQTLFDANFDVAGISRFSLGQYWRTATPAQQQEYQALFKTDIIQTYSNRFTEYSGQTLRTTGQQAADQDVLVLSQVVNPNARGGAPIKVNWRVSGSAPAFKIVDVIIEGVSMRVSERDEFVAVISRAGGNVEALLDELRRKTGRS